MRVVALPVLACDGCGDALIYGAECKPCQRRAALRRALATSVAARAKRTAWKRDIGPDGRFLPLPEPRA